LLDRLQDAQVLRQRSRPGMAMSFRLTDEYNIHRLPGPVFGNIHRQHLDLLQRVGKIMKCICEELALERIR
jgi:hypothetical protein